MKNLRWLLSIVIVGCLSCASPEGEGEEPEAAAPEAAAPEATDVDEAAVRAVAESWDPAVNAKDIDAIMALQADDVVRLPAAGPALVGAAAVREDFAATFESADSQQSNPVSEVQVVGGWAFAYGTYEDRTGDATETGKWTSIFKKTPDGWRYAVDIWNRDQPPAEGASARAGQSPELPEPAVPEELKTSLDAWDEALVAGDVDALVTHYTDDARRMNPGEPTLVGLEAIRASFEKELATPPESSKGTVHGFDIEGDWAYVWGTWAETRGGQELRGKWLEVMKRAADGWKIYIEMWNRGV